MIILHHKFFRICLSAFCILHGRIRVAENHITLYFPFFLLPSAFCRDDSGLWKPLLLYIFFFTIRLPPFAFCRDDFGLRKPILIYILFFFFRLPPSTGWNSGCENTLLYIFFSPSTFRILPFVFCIL